MLHFCLGKFLNKLKVYDEPDPNILPHLCFRYSALRFWITVLAGNSPLQWGKMSRFRMAYLALPQFDQLSDYLSNGTDSIVLRILTAVSKPIPKQWLPFRLYHAPEGALNNLPLSALSQLLFCDCLSQCCLANHYRLTNNPKLRFCGVFGWLCYLCLINTNCFRYWQFYRPFLLSDLFISDQK